MKECTELGSQVPSLLVNRKHMQVSVGSGLYFFPLNPLSVPVGLAVAIVVGITCTIQVYHYFSSHSVCRFDAAALTRFLCKERRTPGCRLVNQPLVDRMSNNDSRNCASCNCKVKCITWSIVVNNCGRSGSGPG
ncbi:hypothetical protein BKA93DRAFT_914925, partial [Sparassis latifolia]